MDGDPVSTAGPDGLSIDDELEALPEFVRFPLQDDARLCRVADGDVRAPRGFDQLYRLPNPARNQSRTPVPTEHVLRLPHESALFEVEHVRCDAVLFEIRLTSLPANSRRGFEVDPKLVLTLDQTSRDVDLQRREHIVVASNLLAVQEDRADRIEAFKTQNPLRILIWTPGEALAV